MQSRLAQGFRRRVKENLRDRFTMLGKSQCFSDFSVSIFFFLKGGLAKFTPAIRMSGIVGNGDTRGNWFTGVWPVSLLARDSAL